MCQMLNVCKIVYTQFFSEYYKEINDKYVLEILLLTEDDLSVAKFMHVWHQILLTISPLFLYPICNWNSLSHFFIVFTDAVTPTHILLLLLFKSSLAFLFLLLPVLAPLKKSVIWCIFLHPACILWIVMLHYY